MKQKDLNELLEKNFANVNSWLNFAEAKNAVNLSLVIASVAAILSMDARNILLNVICILFCISAICSIWSFFPKLGEKLQCFFKEQAIQDADNLLFFEDIKKYTEDEYVKKVNKNYFNKESESVGKYQLDIANEIVYNAKVASYKYKMFKVAVCIDVVAFIMFILNFIIA